MGWELLQRNCVPDYFTILRAIELSETIPCIEYIQIQHVTRFQYIEAVEIIGHVCQYIELHTSIHLYIHTGLV